MSTKLIAKAMRKEYEAEKSIRAWEVHDLNLIAYMKLNYDLMPDSVMITDNPGLPYSAIYDLETIGDKNDFATMVDCFYENIFTGANEPSFEQLVSNQLTFLKAIQDALQQQST
jgi:hypothetical protein